MRKLLLSANQNLVLCISLHSITLYCAIENNPALVVPCLSNSIFNGIKWRKREAALLLLCHSHYLRLCFLPHSLISSLFLFFGFSVCWGGFFWWKAQIPLQLLNSLSYYWTHQCNIHSAERDWSFVLTLLKPIMFCVIKKNGSRKASIWSRRWWGLWWSLGPDVIFFSLFPLLPTPKLSLIAVLPRNAAVFCTNCILLLLCPTPSCWKLHAQVCHTATLWSRGRKNMVN